MITPSFGLTATERVLPKLALNFTTAALDSRITFTRTTGASNPATYVGSDGYITAATNNQPRFDYDPVTLVCKGLLIEESRANLFLQSQTFATTWLPTRASVATVSSTAPSGVSTVDQIVEDTSTNSHFIGQTVNPVAGNASITLSIFAKPAGRNFIAFVTQDSAGAFKTSYFNILNGTVGTVASGHTASIEAFSNGWYRCVIVTTQAAASGVFRFYPGPANVNGSNIYQGNGTSGIYIWGAQLEVGAFATSYIPTTTTALTRNADVAAMTGTNFSDWFNAGAGGVVARVLPSTVSGTRPALQFDDNTANEIIALRGSTTNPELVIVDGGAPQAQIDAGTIAANTAYNLGAAWNTDNCAAAVNGGAAATDTTATIPTVTQARLGSDGTNYLNGHLQTVRYWPQRIINAEVQAFSK
jgi:hypothetical protein